TVPIQVTNTGSKAWTASGPGSVRLIWQIKDPSQRVVSSAAAPIALPPLSPTATTPVTLAFTAPPAVGDYTFTVGLADANGVALAAAGAATGSFTFHVHVAYLVTSVARVPLL